MSQFSQHIFKHMRPYGGACLDPMTAAMVALSAVSAVSQTSAANKAAKATVAEGNIVAANKAKDIAKVAASQKVSFLNSGLTLEGTPMNVIESTFDTGITDLNQISSNYNAKAKSQVSAGRQAGISSLFSAFAGASMAGMGGTSSGFASGSSFGAGTTSLFNGTGYGFGADIYDSFGGQGFAPGEFV